MSNRDRVLEVLAKGPQTLAQLVVKTGLLEQSCESLLELLESKSVVEKQGDAWQLPGVGEKPQTQADRVLEALATEPLTTGVLIERFGANVANVITGIRVKGLITNEAKGKPWSLSAGAAKASARRKPAHVNGARREAAASAVEDARVSALSAAAPPWAGKPRIIADLYIEADRIQRALVILEGRE